MEQHPLDSERRRDHPGFVVSALVYLAGAGIGTVVGSWADMFGGIDVVLGFAVGLLAAQVVLDGWQAARRARRERAERAAGPVRIVEVPGDQDGS
jgi:hypothetical protein